MMLTFVALLGLVFAGPPAIAGPALSADQFKEIAVGASIDDVEKRLGKPDRMYPVFAKTGERPVVLAPKQFVSDAPTNFYEEVIEQPTEKTTAQPEDMLEVMEYPGGHSRQPYFVVLKDEKVYYKIGPVPKSELDPAAVTKKWGAAQITTEQIQRGDVIRTFEIHAYPTKDVAYIKGPKFAEFQAKATDIYPEPEPKRKR